MSEIQDRLEAARLRMSVRAAGDESWDAVRSSYAEMYETYRRAGRMQMALYAAMHQKYGDNQNYDRYIAQTQKAQADGIKGWFGVTKPVAIPHKSRAGWPLAERSHFVTTKTPWGQSHNLLTGILLSKYGEIWTYRAPLKDDAPKEWRLDAWGNMGEQLALGETATGTTRQILFGSRVNFDINNYDITIRRISGVIGLEDLLWNFAVQHEIEDVALEAVAAGKRH